MVASHPTALSAQAATSAAMALLDTAPSSGGEASNEDAMKCRALGPRGRAEVRARTRVAENRGVSGLPSRSSLDYERAARCCRIPARHGSVATTPPARQTHTGAQAPQNCALERNLMKLYLARVLPIAIALLLPSTAL